MRSFTIASFAALTVLACSGSPEADEAESAEDALANVPAKFVLASAATPSCLGTAQANVPLAASPCEGSPELTFDKPSRSIRLASDPSQCLDVQFNAKTAGAAVMFHPCHGARNQTWRISDAVQHAGHLSAAAKIEAFASEPGANLCLATKDGRMIVDACADTAARSWVLDRRIEKRIAQRGRIVTSLMTNGMIETQADANRAAGQRTDALPPAAGKLAVELVKRAMPRLAPGEAPRVLLVLDDAHHGENAADAARTAKTLRDLLTRTEARLQIEMRLGVEVSVTKIQAIIEDEASRVEIAITERRAAIRLLVAAALIITTTKAVVELIDEPASGLPFDGLRMKDGKQPHVAWLSNPGHVIDDQITIDALIRFAQRGGGVVVQGDDAAQNTAALTGLALRAGKEEANGHKYCGQDWDNGTARYPLASRSLPVEGLVYTDDLDLVKIVDPRVQVLATATPSCNGSVEALPAIVAIDPDR